MKITSIVRSMNLKVFILLSLMVGGSASATLAGATYHWNWS